MVYKSKARRFGVGFASLAGAALLLVVLAPVPALAADGATPARVTFYKDVLPIIQENCQNCHRPFGMNTGGMVAPMSFTTYREVRPWAKAIVKQVQSRAMPPWFASPEFNDVFDNTRVLTDEEIATFTNWVKTGAARGNPNDAPSPLDFASSEGADWSIGKPDLVIEMEPFFVEDDVVDQNISFTSVLTEEELPEDRWVQAIEYKAGSEVVHHMCNSATAPGERIDLESFERNGLGCIAPGSDLRTVPEGFGTLLPKGATIRWGMHYHKENGPGTGVWDQSQMAFKFNKTPVEHRVAFTVISSGNGWEIPPNHGNWAVGAARTFDVPTTILSYLPHMHFRGGAAEYRAFYPDGTNELLLQVNEYDYNWQTIYRYKEPKLVPAGTRVEVTMWFDNSPERGEAANLNSERAIRYGGPTTDEMMNGWIGFANTEPKDFKSLFAEKSVASTDTD